MFCTQRGSLCELQSIPKCPGQAVGHVQADQILFKPQMGLAPPLSNMSTSVYFLSFKSVVFRGAVHSDNSRWTDRRTDEWN